MSSLIYVLRSPAHPVPPSLYVSYDQNVVTFGVENAVDTVSPLESAEVLQSGNLSSLKTGERLTHKQLLEVLLDAKKVIIL